MARKTPPDTAALGITQKLHIILPLLQQRVEAGIVTKVKQINLSQCSRRKSQEQGYGVPDQCRFGPTDLQAGSRLTDVWNSLLEETNLWVSDEQVSPIFSSSDKDGRGIENTPTIIVRSHKLSQS